MLLGIFFLCFISRHPGVKEFFILCLISSHPGVWRNFFILQLDQQSSLNERGQGTLFRKIYTFFLVWIIIIIIILVIFGPGTSYIHY